MKFIMAAESEKKSLLSERKKKSFMSKLPSWIYKLCECVTLERDKRAVMKSITAAESEKKEA